MFPCNTSPANNNNRMRGLLVFAALALFSAMLSVADGVVVTRGRFYGPRVVNVGYAPVVGVSRYSVYRPGIGFGRRSLLAAAPAARSPSGACMTVLQVLDATPELSRLRDISKLLSGDIVNELKGLSGKRFTLFAPDNEAIEQLVKEVGPNVNETIAATILSYHIVPGAAAFSNGLKDGQKLVTGLSANNSPIPPLTVSLNSGAVIIKGVGSEAVVTKPDIAVCNGVVHIVDTVLLPVRISGQMMASGTASAPTAAAKPQ